MIKVQDLVMARPLLEKLATKEMHPEAALELAAFLKEITEVINEFERKRGKYFEKYGELMEDGKQWQIKPENETKFKTAVDRGLNLDVDIEPFNLTNSGVMLTPAELINVLPLFK